MSNTNHPPQIVQKMMDNDAFSQWLGIEVEEVTEGYCRLKMTVRPEMLNGFYILHGGVTFALADSCFAFASNSRGQLSVSLQASMSFPNPAKAGDILIAESKELSLSRSSATYDIEIRNQQTNEIAGLFRGVAHRSSRPAFEN